MGQSAFRKYSFQFLIPAYFAPYGAGLKEWEKLVEVARVVPTVAIFNPASGPGRIYDPGYSEVIAQATQAGARLIGYITTAYGDRPISHVIEEIGRYYAFYPEINGIFIDEQSSDPKLIDYYMQVRDAVRETFFHSLIVSSPGTSCDEAYLKNEIGDIFCFFENKTGFEDFNLPNNALSYPASRHAALIYNTKTVKQMKAYLDHAIREKIGTIYITDKAGVNPWDRLPAYWDEEVESVRSWG
jgi:hypothetical protein